MRPKALFWFDVFVFLSLIVYGLRSYVILSFYKQAIAADPAQDAQGLSAAIAVSVGIVLAELTVWFLVSRLRQQGAMWLWVGIAVFSLMGLPQVMKDFVGGGFVVADVLYFLLYFGSILGSLIALLRSSTRAWLAGKKA